MKTLREARKASRKTQLDIQRETGICQTKLSLEENGIRALTVTEMMKLEKYLGTEINWVLHNPITTQQQKELGAAISLMFMRFGQRETLRFASKFETVELMYDVLCGGNDVIGKQLLSQHHSRCRKEVR